jgi:hypothetical protein
MNAIPDSAGGYLLMLIVVLHTSIYTPYLREHVSQ